MSIQHLYLHYYEEIKKMEKERGGLPLNKRELEELARMYYPGLREGIKLEGHFEIKHFRDGELIDHRPYIPNLVTNAGKAAVAALILTDVAEDDFDEIAIGIGATAADVTDTALDSEITTNGGERRTGANVTGTRVTTDVTNDTAQLVTTFTFTGSFAVVESGVFNDPSAGDLLCRQVFAAVNVVSSDTIQFTWQVDID